MILVTGSLAFDQIMDFPGKFSDHILPDKIHVLNVSFLVKEMRKGFGGTAGNIAYNLSLLGLKTCIMAVAGEDFGAYRDFLEKNEVDTSHVKVVPHLYTSTAFGITDLQDNQIWGFYAGADDLSENLSIFNVKGKIDFGVVAPQNPTAMINFVKEYKKAKIPFLFDPGMQLPWFSAEDLRQAFSTADIIIGNDYEIGVMEKKTGIADLGSLSEKGKIIITTLGEKGSVIVAAGKKIFIEAAEVSSASDPTGAGDAYRAGFLAGYMRGFSLEVCGRIGSVAAAYTVEKYGTTTHFFTRDEFIQRYERNYNQKIEL